MILAICQSSSDILSLVKFLWDHPATECSWLIFYATKTVIIYLVFVQLVPPGIKPVPEGGPLLVRPLGAEFSYCVSKFGGHGKSWDINSNLSGFFSGCVFLSLHEREWKGELKRKYSCCRSADESFWKWSGSVFKYVRFHSIWKLPKDFLFLEPKYLRFNETRRKLL